MNRKEYDLVFQALKSYRVYMTPDEEVLSEKILDNLFYTWYDKIASDDSLLMQRKLLRMNQRSTESNHLTLDNEHFRFTLRSLRY